jgi:hypothetical protein
MEGTGLTLSAAKTKRRRRTASAVQNKGAYTFLCLG